MTARINGPIPSELRPPLEAVNGQRAGHQLLFEDHDTGTPVGDTVPQCLHPLRSDVSRLKVSGLVSYLNRIYHK